MMATFPFLLLEDAALAFAKALRDRWRGAVVELAGEVKKALPLPPSHRSLSALDDILDGLSDQASLLSVPPLSLAAATGMAVAGLPWTGQWVPPSAGAIEAKRAVPRFADTRAMQFASGYTFSAVKTKDAGVMGAFRLHLLDAIRFGKPPADAAKRVSEELGDSFGEWERIARTEMARALNMGLFDEAERLGVEAVYVPANPSACDDCKRLLVGRLFDPDSLSSASNVGQKRGAWIAALPLHPNCTCLPVPAPSSMTEGLSFPIPPKGIEVTRGA